MCIITLNLSGCAAVMAANQPSKIDEGVLAVGIPRDYVMAEPHFGVLAKVLLLRGYENLPDDAAKIHLLAQKLGAMPEAERRSHPAWL